MTEEAKAKLASMQPANDWGLDDQALHDLVEYEKDLGNLGAAMFRDILECVGCSEEYKQKKELLEEAAE